jgi:hypothetical protein
VVTLTDASTNLLDPWTRNGINAHSETRAQRLATKLYQTHPTVSLLLSNPLPRRGDDHQGRSSFLLQITCRSSVSHETQQ